jgi:hypothetical protein
VGLDSDRDVNPCFYYAFVVDVTDAAYWNLCSVMGFKDQISTGFLDVCTNLRRRQFCRSTPWLRLGNLLAGDGAYPVRWA